MTGSAAARPWVLCGRRVATPDGIRPAAVHVLGERIAAVTAPQDVPAGAEVVEAGEALVFPGLVDTHVHINEPGRTDWEGFETATRAAAAGGTTTLVDMPLNSIPATTTAAALQAKRAAAEGRCAVDVGFLGGVVPGNAAELAALHGAGVLGFKAFLSPSGVDEFPAVDEGDLGAALRRLASLGAVLMVHAELPALLRPPSGDPRQHATWLASRPAAAEAEAVRLLVRLAREAGARVHVVHVSAEETLGVIAGARRDGVSVTAETCPHYLAFTADVVPDGATEYKCAPPIREARHREALWEALATGTLDAVVSDHSPAPPERKGLDTGDFVQAWGGIASLQLRLPAVWTGARARGVGPERLVEWLCAAPARLAGLEGRKGALVPGADADLVVWDPEAWLTVTESALRHRHPLTPWLGRRLAGVVRATYLRGSPAYVAGASDPPPRGRLITRSLS